MSDTAHTIKIAGLTARIESLIAALQSANVARAEIATMDAKACAFSAQMRAERDALAAELAQVRAAAAAAALLHQQATTAYEGERADAARLRAELAAVRRELEAPADVTNLAAYASGVVSFARSARERSKEVERLTEELADARRGAAASAADALRERKGIGRAIKITPTLLAAALVGSRDGSVTPAAAAQAEHLLSLAGELFIAPPTSPTAARPVFAWVSEEELDAAFEAAYRAESVKSASGGKDPRRAAIRAVLARLEVSLVTPVDPREFALVMIMRDLTDDNGDVSTTAVEAAARYAITARGIPVTPEVGK